MKLVVDSNILFSFFWKSSHVKDLIFRQDLELYSPEHSLNEIEKYAKHILLKTGISRREFNALKEDLGLAVYFVPLGEYSKELEKVLSLTKNLPGDVRLELLNDADFIALALWLKCPLWSNDKLLKLFKKINVLNSGEVIDLLSSLQ